MISIIPKPVASGIITSRKLMTREYEAIDYGSVFTFDYTSPFDIIEEFYDGSTITIRFEFILYMPVACSYTCVYSFAFSIFQALNI